VDYIFRWMGMQFIPGYREAPFSRQGLAEIEAAAVRDATVLVDSGFDGVIVENMHDRPYVQGVKPPEIVAGMTRMVLAVRRALDARRPGMALGVQVLSGGNMEAIAIAHAAGAQFIRCENFVFAHVADEGLLARAEAGELLRYRRRIGAEGVKVLCDLKKKHASHAITADVSIAEAAEAARFFGADGVIVTGTATGKPTSIADVEAVARVTDLPVLVGSGVTPESAASLLEHADALIVGSFIKQHGEWENSVDEARCVAMAQAVRAARAARG
jgi:membrane complex biogenesis BtpA family protein